MLLRRTVFCTLCLSSLFGLSTRVVRSETSRDRLTAQALSDEAARLMASGNYPAGCRKYEESERLDPSAERLFAVADCHERQGKIATAWVALSEASEMADLRGQSSLADEARAHKKHLEPYLGRLNVSVSEEAAGITGLQIERDGVVLARAAWGLGVPVDPGVHVISATAPGRQKWSAEIGLAPGPGTVSLRVPTLAVDESLFERRDGSPLPTASVSNVPSGLPDAEPSSESTGGGQRTVGIVLGATGIASLAVGAGFALAAASTHDELMAECAADLCPPSAAAARDTWRTQASIADVALGLGVASLAAGVVIYFLTPSSEGTKRAHQ